jgi:hypothetical protein
MKYFFLFIFLVSISAHSQKAFIKEIRRKANPDILNVSYSTIIYPIITTTNPSATSLINNKIQGILDSDEEKRDLKNQLDYVIKNGLTDVDYEITYNKNNILSINISTPKEEFNHIYRSISYFNFDPFTGNDIQITDLIEIKKLDGLKKIVFQDKIHNLEIYKREVLKNYLIKNKIDSLEYTWAFEEVDNNCIKVFQMETFSLSNNFFEIVDPCEFPGASKWKELTYELKYSVKYIRRFLKAKYQNRI